ncbi:unnamed protein product [Urochloa decumbens]|uniref:CHCH domain-containing protein n=1 Tax=Urochloa decumbens TaxID=240449 RepID=A0ABC8VY29_9POAL
MPRRSGGGGGGRMRRSSFSAPRAAVRPAPPPPAPRKAPAPAPAPAPAVAVGGGVLSTITDGYLFGTGAAMAHMALDAVFGRRRYEVEHTVAAAPAMGGAAAASSPCDLHSQVFQDCINQNGSDISRCQYYVDLLNECRSRAQVADVQA